MTSNIGFGRLDMICDVGLLRQAIITAATGVMRYWQVSLMYKIILVGLAALAYTVYDPTALSAPIIAGLCVVALIILVIGRLFGIVERDIANRRPEDRRQSGGTAGENWGPNQQD